MLANPCRWVLYSLDAVQTMYKLYGRVEAPLQANLDRVATER